MIGAALMILRIEEKRERHFEGFRNLERIELELERRLDPAHDRRNPEPRWNFVIGKTADELDAAARQTDFLFRFAQCGCGAIAVGGLDAAAGKADLARMVVQMLSALRQQHIDL